jgi:hypothetical protein
MIPFKKQVVLFACICFIAAGIAATTAPEKHPKRNLKILPRDISHEDLDKVMDGFKAALGVKCNFCHAAFKDTSNHHLDFASDEKEEKNIARHMMLMTAKINKKFFSFNKDDNGKTVPAVSCITCHRGDPHPEAK